MLKTIISEEEKNAVTESVKTFYGDALNLKNDNLRALVIAHLNRLYKDVAMNYATL